MRRTHTMRVAAAACCLAALAAGGTVRAEEGGWYLGANFGQVINTYRHTDLDNALNDAFEDELTYTSSSISEKKQAWWAAVGYMTSPYLGFEASYLALGRLDYHASAKQTSVFGTTPVTVDLNLKSRGPAAAVVGVLPLTNSWEVDARVGAYDGKTTTSYTSVVNKTTNNGLESKTSVSLLVGVGTAYTFSGHWALRVDYLHINQVKEQVLGHSFNEDLATAGITFAF